MTITQLIELLIEAKQVHGDLKVMCCRDGRLAHYDSPSIGLIEIWPTKSMACTADQPERVFVL